MEGWDDWVFLYASLGCPDSFRVRLETMAADYNTEIAGYTCVVVREDSTKVCHIPRLPDFSVKYGLNTTRIICTEWDQVLAGNLTNFYGIDDHGDLVCYPLPGLYSITYGEGFGFVDSAAPSNTGSFWGMSYDHDTRTGRISTCIMQPKHWVLLLFWIGTHYPVDEQQGLITRMLESCSLVQEVPKYCCHTRQETSTFISMETGAVGIEKEKIDYERYFGDSFFSR